MLINYLTLMLINLAAGLALLAAAHNTDELLATLNHSAVVPHQ